MEPIKKYLSNGKKVAIMSQATETEYVVQEILISQDKEILSGNNFIASNLRDEPLETWQERDLKRTIKRCKEEKKQADEDWLRFREQSSLIRKKFEYLEKVVKNLDKKVLNDLADYLTGEMKYVVISQFSSPEIIKFKDFDKNEVYDKSSLRLISFFGKDDGTFNYVQEQYSDGSGSHKIFYPFKTLKEAKQKAQEILNTRTSYYEDNIKIAKKWNLNLNKDLIKEYYERNIESKRQQVKRVKKELVEACSQLKEKEENYKIVLNSKKFKK